jgi:hypothetical protein
MYRFVKSLSTLRQYLRSPVEEVQLVTQLMAEALEGF